MTNPILTNSNASASNSERLNADHIRMLKDQTQVDSWSTCVEGGWFCIIGFKGRHRVLYAHCSNSDEFEQMMDPEAYFKRICGEAGGFDAYREAVLLGEIR